MFFRVRGSEVVLDNSSCKLSSDYPYSSGFGVEAVMVNILLKRIGFLEVGAVSKDHMAILPLLFKDVHVKKSN